MEKEVIIQIHKQMEAVTREAFYIPRRLPGLYIEINTGSELGLMGYIILKDEKGNIRLQKPSGYGDRCLCLGSTAAGTTTGGVPGPVNAGRWELIVCIFTEYVEQFLGDNTVTAGIRITDIKPENQGDCEYIGSSSWISGRSDIPLFHDQYDWEKVYKTGTRWYKGDFHTHTRLSDGKETVEHAMEKASRMDMDFYVPTEHNVIHTGWVDTDILVVPGIEITTQSGHCNLFGIDRMPSYVMDILSDMSGPDIEKYMELTWREAKELGWHISINHPFLHIWKWELGKVPLEDIDFLEIVNDPTYEYATESNQKAIRFLDWLWQDGHRIYGIGGSDSHNLEDEYYDGATEPSIAGDPGTFVCMQELSFGSLMSELKKGHIYVSRRCTLNIKIYTDHKEYLPGDEVVCRERTTVRYNVKIHGLKERPLVYMVVNRVRSLVELEEKWPYVYEVSIPIMFDPGVWMFARLDVRDKEGRFLAYVNPIYSGDKDHKYNNWQDALSAMEEEEND